MKTFFQASIILSRNQNPPRLPHPVGNRCVKRGNKLGKKPKEKENVEFKNNDEKIRIIQLKKQKAKVLKEKYCYLEKRKQRCFQRSQDYGNKTDLSSEGFL